MHSLLPTEIGAAVTAAPRGCYQRALVDGSAPWSGAGLVGAARQYGSRYARSRNALLARIQSALPAGWAVETRLVLRGEVGMRRWRRVLALTHGGDVYPW